MENGRIQTNGTQVFSVPNDSFGRVFLSVMRENLNKKWYTITVRGRAKDRRSKGGNQETQPTRTADWLAVYVSRRGESEFSNGYRRGRKEGIEEIARLISAKASL